jgi:hypothetical protein
MVLKEMISLNYWVSIDKDGSRVWKDPGRKYDNGQQFGFQHVSLRDPHDSCK